MSAPPRIPTAEHDVFEIDWPLFGELSRALALRVAAAFDPDMIVGITKAGVIPGAVIASMLQRDFASMGVTRERAHMRPTLVTAPPDSVRNRRVLIVDETCDSGDTLKLALNAVRKHSPAEVRTAVAIQTGTYRPDFVAMRTKGRIVLPWDQEVLDEADTPLGPDDADVYDDGAPAR